MGFRIRLYLLQKSKNCYKIGFLGMITSIGVTFVLDLKRVLSATSLPLLSGSLSEERVLDFFVLWYINHRGLFNA